KLLEVIRNEKDPELRRVAIRVLGQQKNTPSSDALVQTYNAESDAQIKRSILDSLQSQRNVTALISLARSEKDPKMQLKIVEYISNNASRSKEAADYLAELLK